MIIMEQNFNLANIDININRKLYTRLPRKIKKSGIKNYVGSSKFGYLKVNNLLEHEKLSVTQILGRAFR